MTRRTISRRSLLARQRVDIVDHLGGALLIGLDREPKTVPAGERRLGERGGDHVERQLQPVGFLGVDGEIQVEGLGLPRQLDQARHQLAHHAVRGSTASKRGCSAESFTEMPGRSGRGRLPAARPIASIALA